jgi:probable rRNA maturation factor
MTSSDDPDRDRRPNSHLISDARAARVRTRATTSWSRAARNEYSAPGSSPGAGALGTAAKRAARASIAYLWRHHSALDRFAPARVFALDLSFVSDDEMTELNASYRGKNKPTDVLSFAQTEGEPFLIADAGEEVLLGDIVIAIGTARRQALELRHSLEREIAFLTVHGVLHLCGFDHDTSSRRRAMWKLQDAIIESLFAAPDSPSCSLR